MCLTFDEVDAHQRPPLTVKVSREMLHFLVAVLDLIQLRRVGALQDPDGGGSRLDRAEITL